MKIETFPTASLKPHPRNVRRHPEENLAAIAASLKKWGQQKPIVVDVHGQVIAGNGTLEAARRLSWKAIQIVRTTLDGPQAEAFAIADNKTTDMSEFDYSALATTMRDLSSQEGLDLTTTGFQKFELEPLLGEFDASALQQPKPEEGSTPRALRFSNDEWEIIQQAIEFARKEYNDRYDTSSDAAALAAFCFVRYEEVQP